MHFVESYRKLTRLPKPDKKRFRVEDLVNRVKMLYLSFENSEHVKLQVSIQPPDLELTADENLISQVLLNLLKNALEAIAKQPDGRIQIIARCRTNNVLRFVWLITAPEYRMKLSNKFLCHSLPHAKKVQESD